MTAPIDAASAAQLELFLAHLQAGRKQQANAVMQEMLAASPGKAGAFALLIGGMLAQIPTIRAPISIWASPFTLSTTTRRARAPGIGLQRDFQTMHWRTTNWRCGS